MKPSFRLIPDFIIPNLERATYGRHLIWDNKNRGSFKISRIHQSSEQWNDECIAVYKAWSIMKKLWKSDDPKNVTKAKHRLITALRRNPVVEMLETESNYYRFRLITINPEDSMRSRRTENCEMSFSLENAKEKTDDNPANFLSKSPDISQSLKVFMALPGKATNELESPYCACDIENELTDERGIASIFPEMSHMLLEENMKCSDTCCCAILLDSTLLSNERCIWHGGPI